MATRKGRQQATKDTTAQGFTGDSRNMAMAGRVKRNSTGWRYWDRGMHPNTADLTYLDNRAPGSVGTFLPDAVSPIPTWLESPEMSA